MNVLKLIVICAMSATAFSYAMESDSEIYKNKLRLALQRVDKADKEFKQAMTELVRVRSEWRNEINQLHLNNTTMIKQLEEPYITAEREVDAERLGWEISKL